MNLCNLTVLVIDADPLRVKNIKQGFRNECRVIWHTSLETGEQYLQRSAPSLVLSFCPLTISTDVPVLILERDIVGPYTAKKLQELLISYALPYEEKKQLTEELALLKKENKRLSELAKLQSDYLKLAGEVQRSMLKETCYPDGVRIGTSVLPLFDLTGDFYYYKRYGNKFYVIIGDVVDHGASAAIYMTELLSFLYALLQKQPDLKELIHDFNYLARYYNHMLLSATAFFGIIDLEGGVLEYCSIGHEMPVLITPNGISELSQTNTYLPVGFNEVEEFDTDVVHLEIGDKLFLYTDGLTEEFNSLGVDELHVYGEKHLFPFLDKHRALSPENLCSEVVNDMQNFIAGKDRNDDVLVLCIERTGLQ